jgi:hypothetical protein
LAYGEVTYGFDDADAWALWVSAIRVARFYHCAAHGIDLTSPIPQFVPIHLPITALLDVGLSMPLLSLVLSYPSNPFLTRRFNTPQAVIHTDETFCIWVDYHVLWLAECILRSSQNGLTTEWNFGAVIGMQKVDFIHHITAVESHTEPYNYLDGLSGRLFQYHELDMGMFHDS